MFVVHPVEDWSLPDLQPYLTMRRYGEHHAQGIFVAEGEKVVRRLLDSPFLILSILLTPEWLERLTPILRERPEQIAAYTAPKKAIEEKTGFSFYQGLLAIGRIPKLTTIDELLAGVVRPCLLAAVDGLASAENLGGVVRNCAAFGAHGLIVGENSSSPFLRRAVRASMGTVFKLPVVEVPDMAETIRYLGRQEIASIAAHPRAEEQVLSKTDLARDCVIVFGSEGFGISERVLEACQERAVIPMKLGVDSLNVGYASAAFLYEAARQRGWA